MKIKQFLSLLITTLLLLSSCSAKTPVPQTNEGDDAVYEQINTDSINGVYIITEKGPVPIAYTKNGKLALSGDVYYYNLENILENDDAVKQKTFTRFDETGKNIGSLTYADFKEYKENPYKTLALSGNWRLCPDMRRIQFGENDKVPSEYSDFILQSFETQLEGKEVTVTDLWETDLDCDGTKEAVVKAKDDDYTVIVLLSETIGNSVVYSHFGDDGKTDAIPFFADLDGNTVPSLMILSGNTLKTICVFKEKSVTINYCVYLPIA